MRREGEKNITWCFSLTILKMSEIFKVSLKMEKALK